MNYCEKYIIYPPDGNRGEMIKLPELMKNKCMCKNEYNSIKNELSTVIIRNTYETNKNANPNYFYNISITIDKIIAFQQSKSTILPINPNEKV